MRFEKILLQAIAASGFLFLASCAKVGPSGANGLTGPAGPAYTNGVIMGHVSFYDQYGDRVLTALNKTQISLNSGPTISPDTTGFFVYTNVSTGNYTLAASDSGYAATALMPFQCVTDTVYKDIRLSAKPDFVPVSMAINKLIAAESISVSFPDDARTRSCILFLNNTAAVNHQPSGYVAAYSNTFAGSAVGFTIPAQDFYNYGFASGDKVYYAAYSYSVRDCSVYEDLISGKNVYNAVSDSALIDSAIVP